MTASSSTKEASKDDSSQPALHPRHGGWRLECIFICMKEL
jgi:hypothetical protein